MKGNPISEKFTPKQKIVEKAIDRLLKKGLKAAADALLGPGAGTLMGKPVLVGVGSLLFSPRIGGCDTTGVCKDMLAPQNLDIDLLQYRNPQ